MAAEDQRRQERDREKRASSIEPKAALPATSENMQQAVDTLASEMTTASVRARTWLRPLRAALPKIQASVRGTLARMPRVDVIEREDEVVVRAAVAGIPKSGIDVALTNSTLTIRGTVPESKERGDYSYHELPHGGFERRVSLPCEVQTENAAASIRDGMLELVLPKAERARAQAITIR